MRLEEGRALLVLGTLARRSGDDLMAATALVDQATTIVTRLGRRPPAPRATRVERLAIELGQDS